MPVGYGEVPHGKPTGQPHTCDPCSLTAGSKFVGLAVELHRAGAVDDLRGMSMRQPLRSKLFLRTGTVPDALMTVSTSMANARSSQAPGSGSRWIQHRFCGPCSRVLRLP